MEVRFPNITQNVDSTNPQLVEFRSLVAVAKHGVVPGEMVYPKCVAIHPTTNNIYVTEGGRVCPTVSIFSEAGHFIGLFQHKTIRHLCGIAVHTDNLYVTDTEQHYVFQFEMSADFFLLASFGGLGSGIEQLNMPQQITVSTNGNVFVADRDNNRIQILDSDLNHQRHISHLSMTRPNDVKLTPDEVFVLTPQDSTCIHVFSHAGDKIRSLVTCSGIGMQVCHPRCFCLGSNGNLVISDWRDHQIKKFSKEGTLLHTLGERGCEVGMFNEPHGLALIDNLKLVVLSWNKNYGLQIFSH